MPCNICICLGILDDSDHIDTSPDHAVWLLLAAVIKDFTTRYLGASNKQAQGLIRVSGSSARKSGALLTLHPTGAAHILPGVQSS